MSKRQIGDLTLWYDNVDPTNSETIVEFTAWWLNTATGQMFQCIDATMGAQVWQITSLTASTLINHGLLIGRGTKSSPVSMAVASTGTVLTGLTGADPVFTSTPQVTSISFGGSFLSNYTSLASFTPVLAGTTVAGSATYTTQLGRYIRIGDLVTGWINLSWTATTGVGNTLITGLPVSANGAISPICNFQFADITLTAGGLAINGRISGTQITLVQPLTAVPEVALVLPAAGTLQCSFTYSV